MRVFITGATGYIGAHLAFQLATQGYNVKALHRSRNTTGLLLHPHIEWVEGDILDKPTLLKCMKNCTHAFHLAAFAKVWAKDSSLYYKVNVEGTANVLEAAAANDIERIVFTSTCGVMGPSGERPIKETDPRTIPFFNDYERSKFEAEQVVHQWNKQGLDIVTVNPPRVYGAGVLSESNAVTRLIQRFLKGRFRIIPGNGKTAGCYAYINDVVQGHILAMMQGKTGERYILGGENITYHDFFATLQRLSGIHFRMFPVPVPIIQAIANLELLKSRLTGKPPLITPQWAKKLYYSWKLSSDKAIQQLGYGITPFEQGMQETINWVKANCL
jgi:nucleoside-diphosphate-sugar epimerase